MLLMYMTAYMQTNVNAPPDKVPSQLLLIHFTLGIITPIGQLTRALIVGMNLFSTLCVGLLRRAGRWATDDDQAVGLTAALRAARPASRSPRRHT